MVFGVIISFVLLGLLYYTIARLFQNIKEGMTLQESIQKTNSFVKLPEGYDSSLSFLTRFDPSFTPPKYTPFKYKSTPFTVNYKCRKITTGMFSDCGPYASNYCKL